MKPVALFARDATHDEMPVGSPCVVDGPSRGRWALSVLEFDHRGAQLQASQPRHDQRRVCCVVLQALARKSSSSPRPRNRAGRAPTRPSEKRLPGWTGRAGRRVFAAARLDRAGRATRFCRCPVGPGGQGGCPVLMWLVLRAILVRIYHISSLDK